MTEGVKLCVWEAGDELGSCVWRWNHVKSCSQGSRLDSEDRALLWTLAGNTQTASLCLVLIWLDRGGVLVWLVKRSCNVFHCPFVWESTICTHGARHSYLVHCTSRLVRSMEFFKLISMQTYNIKLNEWDWRYCCHYLCKIRLSLNPSITTWVMLSYFVGGILIFTCAIIILNF